MKRFFLLSLVASYFLGCASNTNTREFKRRLIFVNENQNTEFKEQILNSIIELRMTKKMVVASWGKPLSILKTPTSIYWSEQWRFLENPHTRYLYFYHDILVFIKPIIRIH